MKRLRLIVGITFVLTGLSASAWCTLDSSANEASHQDSNASAKNDSQPKADSQALATDKNSMDTATDKDKITDAAVLGESELTISKK